MRGIARVASIGAAALLLAAASAEAFTLEGVRVTRANETYPAAGVDPATGDTYLAWAQSRPGHRHLYDAYLQRNGGPRIKLNTRGIGWTFGLDPATHQVAYQQDRNGDSNIRIYDAATGQRDRLDARVNTPAWEYQPSVSGPWLVFGRLNARARPDVRTLVLYNMDTGERRVLDSFTGNIDHGWIDDGQVNGDWVVWQKATHGTSWDVYRYQISTGTTELVPRPAGRYDYVPAVAPDGTMYFARSGNGCAVLATFRRYDTNGVLTSLGRLPAGRDAAYHSFVSQLPDGSRRLYYDSLRCSRRPINFNIYRTEVLTAPVAQRRPASGHAGRAGPMGTSPFWRRPSEAIGG